MSTKKKKITDEDVCAHYRQVFQAHNTHVREASNSPVFPVISEFDKYSSFFVRNSDAFKSRLKSSDRDRLRLEAARYLFCKYPVGSVLSSCWLHEPKKLDDKNISTFRHWFICVGNGRSFYKDCVKDVFTKKEAHFFLTCPHELSIESCMVYAVAKAANAKDGDAIRLAKTKLSARMFEPFWRECVRFFVQHMPTNVAQANDLIDYIQNKHRENNNFSLFGAGYTLKSMLVKTEEWHRELQRVKVLGNVSWDGVPVHNFRHTTKDKHGLEHVWTITQILNSKDLAAEGTAMRHCVFSYKGGCVSGRLSIWSMTVDDFINSKTRKLTIELSNDGRIVQARGVANRSPRPDELHVLELWRRKEGFSISSY